MNHVQARQVMLQAWPSAIGGTPDLPELQIAQALAWLESSYGQGWKPPCSGSNNWGAIQSGRPPCGSDGCLYTDTSPQADGSSVPYSVCFRVYASPVEGAAAAIRTMYVSNGRGKVLAAAKRGAIYDAAAALYDTSYYQGFGATRAVRVQHYADALAKNVQAIAKANGEKVVATMQGTKGVAWLGPALLFVAGVAGAAGVGYLVVRDVARSR